MFYLQSNYSDDEHEIPAEKPSKRKLKNEHSKQKSKKLKKELYKQPTTAELNEMRETENLFNSNLFRLQIKELLTEIQVKDKYKNQFKSWYDKFINFLKKLPECNDVKVSELHERTKFRQFDIKCDQDLNFRFLRPTSYKIVGLYALNAAIGSCLDVDINIEMPKNCFYGKDYLNYRYFTKRYYYLLHLASEMEKAKLCSKMSLCYFIDFNAMPVLKIQPNTSTHVNIKINVVPPEDYFKDSRFLPNKNNLKMIFNSENDNESGTSHYNSMLIQNIRANKNHAFVCNMLQNVQSAIEGLQLLIVWLKQRQLYDIVGVNYEFVLQLLAYLLSERYINKHTSSYQIVRSVWLFLSNSDWQNKPISICKNVKDDTFSLFREYFDVIFLDSSGCYNLTAFLSLDVYLKLKYEAKLAISYLDGTIMNNSFDCLFMKNMPFALQYDAVLRYLFIYFIHILFYINLFFRLKNLKKIENNLADKNKRLFLQKFRMIATANAIINKLKAALNKRALFLVPHFLPNEICSELSDDGKTMIPDVLIGVSLDLDNAFNVLELGPTPHDPKVKEFLSLWGELSSLRR